MLTDRTIQELKDEATLLRRQADLIDQFLKGLEATRKVNRVTTIVSEPVTVNLTSVLAGNGSLSSQIRSALQDIGSAANSRHVARQMIQAGCPKERNGKPLRERVSVELFRMARRGTGGVKKVRRGFYKIERRDEEPT